MSPAVILLHLEKRGLYLEKEFTHRLKDKEGFTSPASSRPSYELKMLQQYIHGVNLQQLSEHLPDRKKQIMLIKFLKHKRNQQVEIFYKVGEEIQGALGKVNSVGRDFVILTTLGERIWIPYDNIESAQTPFGVPEVSSTHQHIVFDDNLRQKLLTDFGKTVAGQDALKQQFFEETFETNLRTWKGTRVTVVTRDKAVIGKIVESKSGQVTLDRGLMAFGQKTVLTMTEIQYIRSVRAMQFVMNAVKLVSKHIKALWGRKYETSHRPKREELP